MAYLKDFKIHIANHDYPSFLKLWEEYCSGDEIDVEELCDILRAVKRSDISEPFGRHVDHILPLWKMLPESEGADEILKLIIDIQTSNQEQLFDLAFHFLQKKYGAHKDFNEKIRLVGLRSKEKFQGAISQFELLSHMEKGHFVFHTAGWGVGEILDVSFLREQLSLEFDYVPGRKELSFATAFKALVPIPDDHFLALRFGSPDLLEKKAKENAVEVIRMLLRDLGPKTAAEIKDELCDLVIPASEWTRWWQNARTKVKKDTMIQTPEDIREPFAIRKREVTHEERLQQVLENKPDANTLIQMVYTFLRDFPETLKNKEFKAVLIDRLTQVLSFEGLSKPQELQLRFFLSDLGDENEAVAIAGLMQQLSAVESTIVSIEVLSFKKRFLMELRKHRPDWKEVFLSIFLKMEHAPLRDYILSELLDSHLEEEVNKQLQELLSCPDKYPETFLWYFQKLQGHNDIPCCDSQGKIRFFESLLILLSKVEHDPEQRNLVKKVHSLLSGGRFAIVRQMMQAAGIEEVKEFLLLASKCHSLSDHDQKIFHALAEVVYPILTKGRKQHSPVGVESDVIWTTAEGYHKLKQRIQQIATVETVENAKEIESARSHGDLRENAEFKAALERRDRLQSELKLLSDQLNKARVITKDDVLTDTVGVGTIVECKNKQDKVLSYTLLGPWDADPDLNILSFQSKLAQMIKGKSVGDTFLSQGEEYTITAIRSYL